jgi:hypothetical protein
VSDSDLKSRAIKRALDFLQSENGQKLVSNPDVQKAVHWTIENSIKLGKRLEETKTSIVKSLSIATEDDLHDLKKTIVRLEKRIKRMKEEEKLRLKDAQKDEAT